MYGFGSKTGILERFAKESLDDCHVFIYKPWEGHSLEDLFHFMSESLFEQSLSHKSLTEVAHEFVTKLLLQETIVCICVLSMDSLRSSSAASYEALEIVAKSNHIRLNL